MARIAGGIRIGILRGSITQSKLIVIMSNTARYLSAGILLHAITVFELFTILVIATLVGAHPLKYPILMMLCLFTLFSQLDARSRFQEYKKVRDQLTEYGPDKRIFKSVSNSRCQRDVALAAARQLGYETNCRVYFTVAGYRWHHLLPNFVKDHPRFFFSIAFWRTTFFASSYHSRYPVQAGRTSIVSRWNRLRIRTTGKGLGEDIHVGGHVFPIIYIQRRNES